MECNLNPSLLASANGADVYCGDWRDLLMTGIEWDTLITDTPYSAKTHSGHAAGVSTSESMRAWAERESSGSTARDRTYRLRKAAKGIAHRRKLEYSHWTPEDVDAFVVAWSPRIRGWFCSITDDVLAPAWQASLKAAGRYAFAPLPLVVRGATVRQTGDGPSSWTSYLVVARWSTPEMLRWGTLDGAYVLPPGQKRDLPVVGGKQPWIMQRIVEDYSRPGDMIIDPCCGAGTTLVAAIRATGGPRRAVGGDVDSAHAAFAAQWIANPYREAPGLPSAPTTGQVTLFGGNA